MKNLKIYCDGGCRNNQKENNIGGYGVVLLYNNNNICHKKELNGSKINTTNNEMELKALLEGLKAIKKFNIKTEVYSDSAYVVNTFLQQWHIKWRQRNFKDVCHAKMWQEILDLVGKFDDISFIKVKGHSGDQFNELADSLANKAMDKVS